MNNPFRRIIHRVLDAMRGEQNLEKFIHRGLKVGKNFHRMGGVIIDPSHCFHIIIGDDVTLAPRVHILAHDASTHTFLGKTRAANVRIGNRVFVGASTIILPGVTIGDDVVIGAGSVVSKDIPSNSLAVGNPARVIKRLDEYIAKEKARMVPENTFSGFDSDTDIAQREHIVAMADKYGEIFIG